MFKFVALVYVFSLICGADSLHLRAIVDRIVGGETTKIQEVPYQAALYFYGYYFCAGCIVSQTHIVTAAHCLEFISRYPQAVTVRVGSSKMNGGGQVLKAKRVIIHPKFTASKIDYDVGIIELKAPMKLSDCVRPLQIGEREPKEGEEVRVSGWGYIKEIGPLSRKLRSVLVKVVDRKSCAQKYKDILPITKRMMCASAQDKDACYGDSGGALVYKNRLVGIVSSGEGCARKEFPGIYTNVANREIRKFIKKETESLPNVRFPPDQVDPESADPPDLTNT